jgi:hypothetical protein
VMQALKEPRAMEEHKAHKEWLDSKEHKEV